MCDWASMVKMHPFDLVLSRAKANLSNFCPLPKSKRNNSPSDYPVPSWRNASIHLSNHEYSQRSMPTQAFGRWNSISTTEIIDFYMIPMGSKKFQKCCSAQTTPKVYLTCRSHYFVDLQGAGRISMFVRHLNFFEFNTWSSQSPPVLLYILYFLGNSWVSSGLYKRSLLYDKISYLFHVIESGNWWFHIKQKDLLRGLKQPANVPVW